MGNLVNIVDVMGRVDRRCETPLNFAQLGIELGLYSLREFDLELEGMDRDWDLTAYWLLDYVSNWDVVGVRVYFFRGEAVAYSDHESSGSGEKFYWVSEKAYNEVREYWIDVIRNDLYDPPTLIDRKATLDLNPVYETANEARCKRYANYNGQGVLITAHLTGDQVEIQYQDLSCEVVSVLDLTFSLNLEN